MTFASPISRRSILRQFGGGLILRRFAGGGAVLCTFSGGLPAAQAADAGDIGRRTPLILVDAGHGGRDPGATGTAGTLEKDVTLASAMALKAALEARQPWRVELTRSHDRFVTPEDRVDMARERGATLFLSLHADTYTDPSVRGASVYTLAKRASDPETEALASRENGLGPGLNGAPDPDPDVSDILASLASRETRAISARVARQMVRDLGQDIPVAPFPRRQANFVVLHAAGIPSVLIEMGFLSNPADEAALNDTRYRDTIARSVARTVDAWFRPTPGGTVPASRPRAPA